MRRKQAIEIAADVVPNRWQDISRADAVLMTIQIVEAFEAALSGPTVQDEARRAASRLLPDTTALFLAARAIENAHIDFDAKTITLGKDGKPGVFRGRLLEGWSIWST